ncbi:hypothetical protein CMI37_33000 [Candidatus Pacearchaeota archaeon]|nr:hypothetical protein [Candidatus Pacearchaeota archaeon]|tara:strand:+ start:1311 stop:4232 length:2922 start_codon:yes stop_codon:yes gene_type:complete
MPAEPTIINYDDSSITLEELLESIVKSKRFDVVEKNLPEVQNFKEGGEALSKEEYEEKGLGEIKLGPFKFKTMTKKAIEYATPIEKGLVEDIKDVKKAVKQIILKSIDKGVDPETAINMSEEYIRKRGYTAEDLKLRKIDPSDIEDPHGINTSMPNYAPGLRLSSIIGGGVGGTVFGARVARSALKGAMTGTKWGSRLGYLGALGGAIAGGAVGAGMSVLGYEAYGDYLNEKGLLYTPTFGEYGELMKLEQGINRPSKQERLDEAKREAILDAKFGTAFIMARPAIASLRPMWRRVWVGGGKNAYANSIQKVKDANSIGVDVNISDASNWALITGLKKAIGRLPVIGGAFRKAEQKKAMQVYHAAGKTFGLDPKHSVVSLGHDIGKVVESSNAAMRKEVTNAYSAVRKLADEKKLSVSLQGLDNIFNNTVRKTLTPTSLEILGKTNPKFARFVQQLEAFSSERLKGTANFAEWDDIAKNLDDLIFDAQKLGTANGKHAALLLNKFGIELEKTLGTSLNGLGDAGKQVAKKLNEADKLYADMITLFTTPEARRFVQHGIKGFSYEQKLAHVNSKETSRLLEKAFDLGSPEAVENLYRIFTKGGTGMDRVIGETSEALGQKLTGAQLFDKAVRIKLMQKFDEALGFKKTGGFSFSDINTPKDGVIADIMGRVERKRFNGVLFKRELSLDNLNSAKGQALIAALKKTSIKPDQLIKFADAAENAFIEDIGSMSVFLARRASIGGAGSLMRAIIPGAALSQAAGVGMAKGLGLVLLARESTKIFANPILLNAFNDALQANLKKSANRGQLWSRAVRELVRQYPDVVADLDNELDSIQERAQQTKDDFSLNLMSDGVKEYIKEKQVRTPEREQPIEPTITPEVEEVEPEVEEVEPEVEPDTIPIPPNLAEKPPITPLANVVQPIGGMRGPGTQPPRAMRGPVTQQRGQALFGATDPVFGGVFAKKGGLVNLVNSYGKK